MSYSISRTIARPFDEVQADTRAALAEQGFGIITEIDVTATFKTKLDVDIPPQVILGACNPGFAHRALQIEPGIATLLPCNVVVRATDDGTVVEAVDAQVLVTVTGNDTMCEVSDEVARRLRLALDAIPV